MQIWKPKSESFNICGPAKGVVDCFFVEAEETLLMVCGLDGSVKLFSTITGSPVTSLMDDLKLHVTCVDLAQDNRWLVQGTTTGTLLFQIQMDLVCSKHSCASLGGSHC